HVAPMKRCCTIKLPPMRTLRIGSGGNEIIPCHFALLILSPSLGLVMPRYLDSFLTNGSITSGRHWPLQATQPTNLRKQRALLAMAHLVEFSTEVYFCSRPMESS